MTHKQNGFGGLHLTSLTGLLILVIQGIIAVYQFVVPFPAAAQIDEKQIEKVLADPNIPWRLEADEISYDQITDEYVASGNVLIYKANIKLLADDVRFDHKNMKAYAEGDVVLTNGEDILSGTRMEIDLEDQTGFVEDGYLFIKENNYHLTGDVIKKVGPKTYTIDAATLTTCDGDKPAWKLTGKKVKIKEDGEGRARHAALWARNVPVLYTPYFYYPARKKRQSGFLWPQGGYSNRWGTYYNQPFFWAIDKSSDATFYGHYMNFRGMRWGLEYRYYLDDWSKGTLMVDGFSDKQIDDGTGDNSKRWGFDDNGRDILRKNHDRYWLRMSHHQKLPKGVTAKLDLDLVSDQDYTRDWKTGYMGWIQSKEYFEEVFSRDLDDSNDPIRTNQLNFNKLWPFYTLNAQLRYDLNSTIRNTHNLDTTRQLLPLIEFDAVKQRIATSPFFYNLNSEYVYFWSREGKRTQRLDAHPRFYLPFTIGPFITLEPSVGVRGTFWRLDKKEFGPENDKKYYRRGLFDTRLDLFSEVRKIFFIQGKTIEAIKHTVRPRVIHDFIPEVDQDDLPNFDAIDRIAKQNLLTYSLTNTLTSKSKKRGSFQVSQRRDESKAAVIDSPTEYNYNDFLRFELEQSYDIVEAGQKGRSRPFSPIIGRLDLLPGKYFSADVESLWSVYDTKFLSHNFATTFWDMRGDRLFVQYRYTRDSDEIPYTLDSGEITLNPAKSLYTNLRLKATDRLTLFGEYEYNFLDKVLIQAGGGLSYTAQCWSLESRYTKKPNNKDFEIKINLFGLGEFGI